MNTRELLGLKIKEYRKNKKLTQEKLAEILELDVGYISKLEVGRNFPTIGTLDFYHITKSKNQFIPFSVNIDNFH